MNTPPPLSPPVSAPSNDVPLASNGNRNSALLPGPRLTIDSTPLRPQLCTPSSAPHFQPLSWPLTVTSSPRCRPRPYITTLRPTSAGLVISGAQESNSPLTR